MAAQPIPDAPFSVAGKVAIVTGAGSGINLEFAKLLVSRGCNVVLGDLSLRPEAAEFHARHSKKKENEEGSSSSPAAAATTATTTTTEPRTVFVETDVTSWPALERLFAAALAEFGRFDVVCPGAGVYEPTWSNFWLKPGTAESGDGEASGRYKSLDINVTHPIRATQLALSLWLDPPDSSPGGKMEPASLHNPKRVVHISSVAGQLPVFRAPIYGAAKHAISGFVRCLAPLGARAGVSVTAVAPGVVRTPLWTDHPEKLKNVDQSRDAWVTPQECAAAMLACVEGRHPAGTVLEVGAGTTRRVLPYNDPGPDFRPEGGIVASNGELGDREVWGWLEDPRYWGRSAKL